jgi:hypothetical protein
MKNLLIIFFFMAISIVAVGQNDLEDEAVDHWFKKEKMFTGGNITASFFTGGLVLGANPHLGYSITKWLDAGINFNYLYTSQRDESNYKYRQHVYGPGAFVRVFPIQFIFLQAHYEYNFVKNKEIPPGGLSPVKYDFQAGSMLLGAGLAQGRVAGDNNFFYLSVMYDVSQSPNSPYIDQYGRSIPVVNLGFNIALFQGKKNK